MEYRARSSRPLGRLSDLRGRMLVSTMLMTAVMCGGRPALANDVTAPGASTVENTADHIYVRNSSGGTTSVGVNTGDLISAHAWGVGVDNTGGGAAASTTVTIGADRTVQSNDDAGVKIISTAAPITLTNNGAIRGDTAFGVVLDSSYGAGAAGAVTLQGSGTVWSNETAIFLKTQNAATTVSGLSQITGASYGIFSLSVANSGSVGAVALGTAASPLASVTATAGKGIYVEQQNGSTSAGDIDIHVAAVTATDDAIEVQNSNSTTNVTATGQIKSSNASGIYVSPDTGSVNISGAGTGTVTGGSSWYGVGVETGGAGAIAIKDLASVSGAAQAIRAVGNTGAISIENIPTITSTAGYGIFAHQGDNAGTLTIRGIGTINATGDNGILVEQGVNGGAISIDVGAVKATDVAIEVQNFTSDVDVKTSGQIQSNNTAIWISPSTGNVSIDGQGTSTVVGGVANYGIWADTGGAGTVDVKNYASVLGKDIGILANTGSGAVNIQGNGPVTANAGNAIEVRSTSGAVTISGNGALLGNNSGIYVPSVSGNVSIQGNGDITGLNYYGIQVTSSGGTINIGNTTANGNIVGDDEGVTARTNGTGNVNIANAAGKLIQGTYGVTTRTDDAGLATVNNAGTIRTGNVVTGPTFPAYALTFDSGAANVPGGALALHQEAGRGVTNNTGTIIGSITTSGSSYALNNLAGGIWTPGLTGNSFGATADTINNAGTINIRSGSTTFSGIETFNNQAGGVINMQYGAASGGVAAAADRLTVMNFSPLSGGIIKIDVALNAANSSGDSGGQGTSDKIIVTGTATPSGVTAINVRSLTAAPTTLTGSIAIVNTNAADLAAPTPGQRLTASRYYTLTGDALPGAGKYKYTLVDDGAGGVFLEWQPNITASTLGAYMGGPLGSAAGSSMAMFGGALAGVGGVGASRPSSGALGWVGDAAASAAIGLKPDERRLQRSCGAGSEWQTWAGGDGVGSSFRGSGSSKAGSFNAGIERDMSDALGMACGHVAAGAFAFGGTTTTRWATGSGRTEAVGGGGFLRMSSESGFYVTALAGAGTAKSDLVNRTFGSTAKQDSLNYVVAGTVGHVLRLDSANWFDSRAFVSYGNVDGRRFTDSVGIVVDGSRQNAVTYGVSEAWNHSFTQSTSAFMRMGVQWSQLDSAMTAFGIREKGRVSATYGTLEVGLKSELMKGVFLQASTFGVTGAQSTNWGGTGRLAIAF